MIITFWLKQLQNTRYSALIQLWPPPSIRDNSLLAKVNLAMFRKLQCRYSIPFLRWTSYSYKLVAFYGRILFMFLLSGRWIFWEVYFSIAVACSQSQWLCFQLASKDYFLKQLQKTALCFVRMYLSPWLLQGQAHNWSYLTVPWPPWSGLGW